MQVSEKAFGPGGCCGGPSWWKGTANNIDPSEKSFVRHRTKLMSSCRLSRLLATLWYAVVVLGSLQATSNPTSAQERWLTGFYPGWEYEIYPPERINFAAITDVVMFSVIPNADGSLDTSFFVGPTLGPRIARDVASRAREAGRKSLLAVGGGGLVDRMRAASNNANRQRFVANIENLVRQWQYDGVDVDWEPIEPTDQADLVALAKMLRERLPDKLLTINLGWKNANAPIDPQDVLFLSKIVPLFDRLNVMTYDMADNWEGWLSWHNSALYGHGERTPTSVASSIEAYMGAGAPAGKLGLGVAFYGSCWSTPVSAPRQATGTARIVAGDQDMSYRNIMAHYYNPDYAMYDVVAQAPYLSPPQALGSFGCTFVSYEDERSIAAKGTFARQKGLGGAVIWSLGEGYLPHASNPNGLLEAAEKAFLDK